MTLLYPYIRMLSALCLPAWISGCSAGISAPNGAIKTEMSADISVQSDAAGIRIGETLTYADAMAKALMENPGLQAFSLEVRAREARRLQASLPPNPELELEVENFAGSDAFRGLGGAEATAQIGQRVLLGGDRARREEVAELDRALALWHYRSKRLDVLAGVTEAYTETLEAQEILSQQGELLETADELFASVDSQFEAGKVAELAVVKARVAREEARISLDSARSKLDAARGSLAAYWGSGDTRFERVAGELSLRGALPTYADTAGHIGKNPDLARWEDEIRKRKAEVAYEEAKAVPDITVSGGIKRFEGEDAQAAIIGVSAPLQLFDRNQGAIRAARVEVERAIAQHREARAEATGALQRAYNALQSARQEATRLDERVLPDARSAFRAAQTGYEQGKFDYLEVLDAQRTLFSAELRQIKALGEAKRAAARVERLIATPLSQII